MAEQYEYLGQADEPLSLRDEQAALRSEFALARKLSVSKNPADVARAREMAAELQRRAVDLQRRAKKKSEPNVADEVIRAGHRVVGNTAGGLAGLAGLIANPLNHIINATGIPQKLGVGELSTDLGQSAREAVNAPIPRNRTERVADAAAEGVVGGGPVLGAARRVAARGGSEVAKKVAAVLAEAPLAEALGGAGAGAAGQAAAEAGAGPVIQTIAALAGGVGGGAAGLGRRGRANARSPKADPADVPVTPDAPEGFEYLGQADVPSPNKGTTPRTVSDEPELDFRQVPLIYDEATGGWRDGAPEETVVFRNPDGSMKAATPIAVANDQMELPLATPQIDPEGIYRGALPETPVLDEVVEAPQPVERAGSIGLKAVADGDADLETVFRQTADNIEASGEGTRRISAEETEQLAENLGMTADQFLKQNPKVSAAELRAGQQLVAQSAQEVVALSRRMNAGETTEEVQEALARAWATHGALQAKFNKVASEYGRGLNILRQQAKGGKRYAAALRNLPNEVFSKENLADLAKLIEEHADNPVAVNRVMRDAMKPKAEDYIFSTWYNMMLSGPQTHAANIAGTASNFMVDLAEHGLSSLLGQRKRWSDNADRVMGREVLARLYGAWHGVSVGLSRMGTAYRLGTPLDMVTRVENPRAFTKGPLQVIETPTRSLAAEDEFFRSVLQLSDLHGMAVRTAAKEGLTGKALLDRAKELTNDPPAELLKHAADYAKLIRFQDDPGPLGQAIEHARQRRLGDSVNKRVARGAVRVFIPFVRTPSSLLRTAVRRSPLGVIESRNIADFKAGGARRDLAIARVAAGSAVTSLLANYALEGVITGPGPKDYRKRLELEASGWRPNSIKIGDEYISYAGLEPLSILLTSVAALTDKAGETAESDEDYFDKAGQMVVAVADVMSDNTWTENLAGLFQILGSNPSQQESAFRNWVANMAGSMTVPALLRQFNQAYVDPVQRSTTGDGSTMDRIEGRIKSGVPGLSDDLPAAHDVYGRPIVREGAVGPDILSRMRTSTTDSDPAVLELQRLSDVNDTTLLGPPGNSNVKVNGVERRLNAEEFQAYQELSGQYVLESVREVMNSPQWAGMDDAERADEVRAITEDMRANARDELFGAEEEEGGEEIASAEGPAEYLGQADEGASIIRSIFPQATVTDNVRSASSALGRANPRSWHVKSKNAVDVRPIPGLSFQEFLQQINDAGYDIVEARDEVRNPAKHATGPHWHVVLKDA